jgi:hypothetical protein|tara:strand:- start:1686 stop:1877 length:192 start_codon:yes stop_codon:yes gene_type:complete
MTIITKEQFQAYEEVRESGATNMWDTNMVSELSEGVLSKKDALEVIKQYNSLCEVYPDVRNHA